VDAEVPKSKVDTENGSELQPVPLGDENQIILGPNGDKNSREIDYEEMVFRPLCIHHQTLCSEHFSNPLVIVRLDPPRP
jgi:hypothetical protein